jgi:Holliday junction resolvase RusA-like endonuclease
MYPEHKDLVWPLSIEYVFHPDTKRRFDMSNKIESINDMLVSSGIIQDDNIFIMSDLHMRLGSMSTSGEIQVEVTIFFFTS